jgi:hypothetical protein
MTDFEQVRMTAADHQGESRELDSAAGPPGFQDYGMDVSFDVIDRYERDTRGETQRFRISEADEQRPHEAGSDRRGYCSQVLEPGARPVERFPDDWRNGAEMLARSEFWNHSAVLAVCAHLGSDDRRKHVFAVFDHGGGSLVAGGFNPEYQHG